MSPRARAVAQPQGRFRAKPGTTGAGRYYRIVVRPKEDFSSFRYHDVGRPGHALRLAGRRASGSWDTQAWLIRKDEARREGHTLVAQTPEAKTILENLGSKPIYLKGDIFRARPRRNILEEDKPTVAQRRAQRANIRKAQAARRRQHVAAS